MTIKHWSMSFKIDNEWIVILVDRKYNINSNQLTPQRTEPKEIKTRMNALRLYIQASDWP